MPQRANALAAAGFAAPRSKRRKLLRLAAVLCTIGFMAHAQAVPFLDEAGDFLPSYTGAKDADLDVLQADVVIDPEARTIAFFGAMRGNITATVPLALFASQGFKLEEYTFNLWPRFEGSLANTVVPDFAPDQGNARVTIAGKRTRFELVRSSRAAAAGCLAHASAEVHIRAEDSVEVMEVAVQGLPPKTEFDVFITQVPNAPFGMAWYQGDIETNHHGRGRQTFVGRFSNETFVVAPGSATAPQVHHNAFPDAQINPPTAPVHTFHVGIWFNSPADAVRAGCPGDVTPFNGEHNAGIQALSSRNFVDAQGPLLNLEP